MMEFEFVYRATCRVKLYANDFDSAYDKFYRNECADPEEVDDPEIMTCEVIGQIDGPDPMDLAHQKSEDELLEDYKDELPPPNA
jgi:hypothetical protein